MELLDAENREFETQAGDMRTYVLSKFPAVQGREIISQYPVTATPKLGDYKTNEEIMLKLMSFVGVPQTNGNVLRLTSRALIDNHVPDWETLARIEIAMMQKNCSFFEPGKVSTFFGAFAQKAQALITRILTDYSAQSSGKK